MTRFVPVQQSTVEACARLNSGSKIIPIISHTGINAFEGFSCSLPFTSCLVLSDDPVTSSRQLRIVINRRFPCLSSLFSPSLSNEGEVEEERQRGVDGGTPLIPEIAKKVSLF